MKAGPFALALVMLSTMSLADSPQTRQTGVRWLSDIVVKLKPNQNAQIFATLNGLKYKRALPSMKDSYIFSAASPSAAAKEMNRLRKDGSVVGVWQDMIAPRMQCQFVPNDPFVYPVETQPNAPTDDSYYLGQAIIGFEAFAQSYTGSSKGYSPYPIPINFLDDGFEGSHPDVGINTYGFDLIDNDNDVRHPGSFHGTAMMGLATARGGNGIGVCGVAPHAIANGVRVNVVSGPISAYVNAMNSGYVSSATVHGSVFAIPWLSAPLARDTLLQTTNSLGLVHLMPSGNLNRTAEADEMLTSSDVIVVSGYNINASTGQNEMIENSAFGPNVFCTAPASISQEPTTFGAPTIVRGFGTTESLSGGIGSGSRMPINYTDQFMGTSASVALMGGALAQYQESVLSRPNMFQTRVIKHLIARNSTPINSEDNTNPRGGWITNAAGRQFNNSYGFGQIRVLDMIRDAAYFDGVTAPSFTSNATENPVGIPDNDMVTIPFDMAAGAPVEDVQLFLNTDHNNIGQLQIELVSPAGTVALLKPEDFSDATNGLIWNFNANTFWGEAATGTWQLNIRDLALGTAGTVNAAILRLNTGQLINRAAVNDAQFIDATFRTPLYRGAQTEATVTVRNTGSTTWSEAQSYRLVSIPFGSSTWGRVNVALGPSETVAPGMLKTFRFNIVAPNTVGFHLFQWQMRRGAAPAANFGQTTPWRMLEVRDGNDAQFVSFSTPTFMQAGQRYYVRVIMKNVGTRSWTNAGNYYLVSQNPFNNTTWGRNNVPLPVTDNVRTNQSKEYFFPVIAPNTRGFVNMQWRMREGGRENFGDFTNNVPVYVTPDKGVLVSEQFEGDFFAGGTVGYTITMRNTGTSTWTRGNFDLVSLIPEAVTTWGWLSEPIPVGVSVPPGGTLSLSVNLQCPLVPGEYPFEVGFRHTTSNRFFINGAPRTFSVN